MPVRRPAAYEHLLAALQGLPGIGRRSAERVAQFLLQCPEAEAAGLAEAIIRARASLKPCATCGHLSETDPCEICADDALDKTQLCVVAIERDLHALAAAGVFPGKFHLLGGLISPLKNIGPDRLRLTQLTDRVARDGVREVVLALPPTTEGETTAFYLKELLPPAVRITRLGVGVPLGADLDYLDPGTLERALSGRSEF